MRKQIHPWYLASRLHMIVMALLLACAQVDMVSAQTRTAPPVAVSVPLVVPEQMSAVDANLATASQPAITRSAQLYGYALDSSYSYREIACPYAPHHLLLAYEAAQAGGPVSRFTAVVVRDADSEAPGAVQIIPILHSGVMPFVPAFSSPHSIDLFNRTVEAEPAGGAAVAALNSGEEPVLVRSLCYAAMVGEDPNALRWPSLERATIQAPVPGLRFLNKGLMQQTFSIRDKPASYQVWTLTFSSSGRLVVAQREERKIDAIPVVLNAGTPVIPTDISPGQGTISAPERVSAAAPLAAEVASPATSPVPPPTQSAPLAASVPTSLPPAAAASAVPPVVPASPPVASPAVPTASIVAPKPAATAASAPPIEPMSPPAKFIAQPVTTLPPLPQPPRRIVSNAPMPPSRIIPDSSLKMPPQAPAK